MFKKLIALTLLGISATAAQAGVIDLASGSTGVIKWKNGGAVQEFLGNGNLVTVTVAQKSTVDFSIDDTGQPGVTFNLFLDGASTALTPSNAGSHYEFFDDILLNAGSHYFTISVLGSNGAGQVKNASFTAPLAFASAAAPAQSAAVAEPGTLALLAVGTIGLFAMRRRVAGSKTSPPAK
ncbi:PEP-CTERM sorting domain-containing protein [Pseudoduganella sp. RAF53_2]|uniref:PEP-CTERM sorting domain-containing protein n=1 Tax=unclassified Pseudoduganella TaxID=2637179 RepID=UPI003F9C1AD7